MSMDSPFMVEHLQLNRIQSALKRQRWTQSGGLPNLFELWRDEEWKREVLLPLNPEKSDFHRLLSQALETLSSDRAMAGESWALSESVLAARMDTTSWKRATNLESGLIHWAEGAELFAAAKASLVAAAKAAKDARRVYGRSGHYIAKQFIESSIMGQTASGSFIVRAHTPSDEMFHLSKRSARTDPHDIGALDRVSGANIIERLGSGITAVRQGLDEYKKRPSLEIFEDLVPDGVSYELLRSLADLSRDGDSRVEILREFSGGSSEQTFSASFAASDSSTLEMASRKLHGQTEPEDVNFFGEVTLLAHESSDPHRVIRVKTNSDVVAKKVRVRLTREQYDMAIEAHRTGMLLHLSGVLERENNLHWLYGAEVLGMVQSPVVQDFTTLPLF